MKIIEHNFEYNMAFVEGKSLTIIIQDKDEMFPKALVI